MSRQNQDIRTGIPRGGRNAAQRRAAAWVSQNSARNFRPRRIDNHRTDTEPTGETAHKVRDFPVIARKSLTSPLTALLRDTINPAERRRPIIKIVPEAIGALTVGRLGSFDRADSLMHEIEKKLPATLTFTAADVHAFSVRDKFFVGLLPDARTQADIRNDREVAENILELTEPLRDSSLVIGRFEDQELANLAASNALEVLASGQVAPDMLFGRACIKIKHL